MVDVYWEYDAYMDKISPMQIRAVPDQAPSLPPVSQVLVLIPVLGVRV